MHFCCSCPGTVRAVSSQSNEIECWLRCRRRLPMFAALEMRSRLYRWSIHRRVGVWGEDLGGGGGGRPAGWGMAFFGGFFFFSGGGFWEGVFPERKMGRN